MIRNLYDSELDEAELFCNDLHIFNIPYFPVTNRCEYLRHLFLAVMQDRKIKY